VWDFHKVYSDEDTRAWVDSGCRSAAFGCLDCKKPLINRVLQEQAEIRERASHYESNPDKVREIIQAGNERARRVAGETMEIVREAVGTVYK
jgi:tryptophanyl-tRNA synthetase